MDIKTVKIDKPADMNFILGQSHFIKTVEDIHEAIVGAVPQMKFGVAFCESSGPALVRFSGNDRRLVELARKNAAAGSAGSVPSSSAICHGSPKYCSCVSTSYSVRCNGSDGCV